MLLNIIDLRWRPWKMSVPQVSHSVRDGEIKAIYKSRLANQEARKMLRVEAGICARTLGMQNVVSIVSAQNSFRNQSYFATGHSRGSIHKSRWSFHHVNCVSSRSTALPTVLRGTIVSRSLGPKMPWDCFLPTPLIVSRDVKTSLRPISRVLQQSFTPTLSVF